MFDYVMLFAQAPAPAPSQSGGPAGFIVQMFPMILIIGIFYMLLIRPQQKKQKEHKDMVANLKKGDNVVTSGGIYGVIAGVKDKAFTVKVADNVKIDVTKGSISTVLKKKEENTG
ncbi:preprotein translocase subunit YajC [PVC group bacterium]|nr:preprotein translocase subunit YajC [PVC group bacterium]